LFVQETLDPRIESVMPILNKLSKNLGEMKEVKALEEWADSLLEAPGAETLAHNQQTELKRMKALDLDEADVEEGVVDTLKKVGKKVADYMAPSDEQTLKDLQKRMGLPAHAQHGKPSMAMPKDEVKEEEVEESGLQAYLGKKKYGEKGMQALQQAGRDGASKEKMAQIRAKYDKLDEVEMDEGLDANQKRVGQLGPTEKVGPKGAVGKLVGANESVSSDELAQLKNLLKLI
jgi:hypothetical protein